MPVSRSVRSVLAALTVAVTSATLLVGASPIVDAVSATRQICRTYCDGSPADRSAPYREVDNTAVYGRAIRLEIDDTAQSAYAVISYGNPGDEVWLDRSWDGGKTWDSKIGDTRIRRGSRSATTTQWNLDRRRATSVVRACGKAGDRRLIACTAWHSTDPLPRKRASWDGGAVTALMTLYNRGTGLWRGAGWWNAANALTSLIDYIRHTRDGRYRWVIAHTYNRDRSAEGGQFTNGYLDDTGWWALAWIRAYDLTHRQRYLRTAQVDVDHMWSYHDGVCGGGLWWSTARKYKNAITNELFIKAAAELHNRLPGDRAYLRKARRTWRWFKRSGMINRRNLINDGLGRDCSNNHQTTWTYNQGVILGGLVDLARATHRQSYLRQAQVLADASTSAKSLHVNGVLTEPCESGDCGNDGPSFKGIYVRNLGELRHATSSARYRRYLRHQASAAYDADRTPYDQYGLHWSGPPGQITGATQQSAVDLMVAALH